MFNLKKPGKDIDTFPGLVNKSKQNFILDWLFSSTNLSHQNL
jgi:hypothetical protein